MLAQTLERVLDFESYSPQIKAVLSILLIGVWLSVVLLTDRPPAHAKEVAAAKQLVFSGTVFQQTLNERKYRQLWIKRAKKRVELPETGFYYQATSYKQLLNRTTGNHFPYDAARSTSLMEQVQIGDSVVKMKGSLTAYIFRHGRAQAFLYKCPYHSYEFDH